MNSIVLAYPGFGTLPRSIKKMLVASEAIFWRDATPQFGTVIQGKLQHAQPPRSPAARSRAQQIEALCAEHRA